LHPYQSRTHSAPVRIPLLDGFLLVPTPTSGREDGPPLPLLGALAMHLAGLKVITNYAKLDFCIQQG
jgi:hypothetical protein